MDPENKNLNTLLKEERAKKKNQKETESTHKIIITTLTDIYV